jgi:hypothetical protein
MSLGSIICAHNLNLGPGAHTTKNRKFLHVTQKSAIGPRIMQGPSLYAQNCSNLSRDPLKLWFLKVATPAVCRHLSQNAWETKLTLTMNQAIMYRSYTCL